MTQSQFVERHAEQLELWASRLESASAGQTEEEAAFVPKGQAWSIAQIAAHLALPAEAYLKAMKAPLAAPGRVGEPDPKLSWIGRRFVKLAGPSSNVPAPPPMQPPASAGLESIARCIEVHRSLAEFCRACQGVDISRAKFRNPYLPFIVFRFADSFAILVAHAERHVLQIEERRRAAGG